MAITEVNPWADEHWNITAQGAYAQKHGVAAAHAKSKEAGSFVGSTRPPGIAGQKKPRPGPPGPRGRDGATGATGTGSGGGGGSGTIGATGPVGATGATGPIGATGPSGSGSADRTFTIFMR